MFNYQFTENPGQRTMLNDIMGVSTKKIQIMENKSYRTNNPVSSKMKSQRENKMEGKPLSKVI